tara:strand:+ start:815 stop:1522 length:708 start_codon:yes stop_codon:yes gene_type:complete
MNMSLGIILTPDNRSKAYIQKILKNNLKFDHVLFMNDNRVEKKYSDEIINTSKNFGFDISKSVIDTLSENKINFKEFSFVDINNPELKKYIDSISLENLIFSGGGILKDEILSCNVNFIHFHPGLTPEYRGSTCFYYSILNDNYAGVTAFFMDRTLDTGDIIFQKKFEKPFHPYLDEIFDPYIRSETLVELIKTNKLSSQNFTKQNVDSGETYYIIHPVLKHIAIMKCVSNDQSI